MTSGSSSRSSSSCVLFGTTEQLSAIPMLAQEISGPTASTHVILRSNDEVEFKLSKECVKLSDLLKDVYEPDLLTTEKEYFKFDIPEVNAKTMQVVVSFLESCISRDCSYILKFETPMKHHYKKYLSEIDNLFVSEHLFENGDEKKHAMLVSVIKAADYLGIKLLLCLACFVFAGLINGKSPEEIRELFSIPNDITPAEQEQIDLHSRQLND